MTFKPVHKKYAVLFVVIVVSISSYVFGIFDSWQEQITDRLFLKQSQPHNIVIVAVDDKSLKEVGQWPWKRENFAKAIQNITGAKAIGIDINFSEPSMYGVKDDELLIKQIASIKTPIVFPIEINNLQNISNAKKEIVTVEPIQNLKTLSTQGVVNVPIENDGTVRYIPQSTFPLFAEAIKNQGASNTPHFITGLKRIMYQGPSQTFLTVSISDVINNKLPDGFFNNSYVLIGASSQSLRDIIKTPFGTMPGVEIHANILATFLSSKTLAPINQVLGIILLILVSLLSAFIIFTSKHFRTLSLSLLILLVVLVIGSLIAFTFGYIFPLLYIVGTFIVSSVSLISLNYIIESKEKKFIKQSFQYYLSADVVDELTKHPEKLKLGGEKRELTILFSDIRGFTTISEALSPEQLVEVINEYLTAMTDIIMNHGGLVDKYIGDAIMAFWGAPLDNKNHAVHAIEAALEMMEKLKELNVDWVRRGLPPLGIGVGINTGTVIVGNMGSQKRFNYTIMGDEVNFASRLEGITKQYGIQCLLSESVVENLSQKNINSLTRKVDMVMVKGKKEPKTIFELVPEGHAKTFTTYKDIFEQARLEYEKGNWDNAISGFNKVLEQNPTDGPSKALLERSMYLKEHQPEHWTGVYEFKTK